MGAEPELAVVMPLEDPRGDIVEHLRTWSDGQTLARDRYQLVLSTNGDHPEFERRVGELLAPHDELVSVPPGKLPREEGAALIALYDAAARAARAPVLVITEAHCRADSECLAMLADAFRSDRELDAATFPHHQHPADASGELTER